METCGKVGADWDVGTLSHIWHIGTPSWVHMQFTKFLTVVIFKIETLMLRFSIITLLKNRLIFRTNTGLGLSTCCSVKRWQSIGISFVGPQKGIKGSMNLDSWSRRYS